MSIFDSKINKSVAEAVMKVLEAEQKEKMAKKDHDQDGKIESGKDEYLGSRIRAARLAGKLKEETQTEMLSEAFPTVADAKKRMAAGKTTTGTVTKTKTGLVHKRDYEDESDSEDTQKASKKTGARQNNFNRGQSTGYTSKAKTVKENTEVKLSFTEMLELYNEAGVEVIAKIAPQKVEFGDIEVEVFDADKINGTVETDIVEEVDNETFTKEVEAQKEKNAGRGKKAEVAKASVQAVKQEEVELEEEYEYISEAEYLELDENEQQLWEAVTSQSYSDLRDKKSKVPATEFGAKGTKTKVLDQIRSHESRKKHSTGKNVYATDYKVGKKDTTEMMYRKKSGKKGQVPSQRAGLRRDRYDESVEQLDEISKKTLGSYIKKASHDVAAKGAFTRHFADKSRAETAEQKHDIARKTMKKADKMQDAGMKRRANMAKAVDRLTKEEIQMDERTLTAAETSKKEDIVKSMKKGLSGFKARYGDRAKEVMYATATKQAKKD